MYQKLNYKDRQFFNNEIYHIVLRGVDENLVFKDIDDYYRGIFSIFEFNTANPVTIREQRKIRAQIKEVNRGKTSVTEGFVDKRDKLVEVLFFSFMPNHIHLLLKQLRNKGVTDFMRKVGTGYAGYFNRKYNRKGHLFQNKFFSVWVDNDEQLKTLFVYIHINPISLVEPKWKEVGISNQEEVIKFLKNYKWSSYSDYIGKKNFPSVSDREFILKIMGREWGCRDFVENWVRYKGEIKELPQIALE